jgi:hypothetical protein
VLKLKAFGIGIFPRKKTVLKHGSYPAFTKHGSITDQAVLEHLTLNSTSAHWKEKHHQQWRCTNNLDRVMHIELSSVDQKKVSVIS